MKPQTKIADIEYVRSVLAGRVASSVCDGDLDPPTGARCTTRAGFRAWLSRNDPPQRRMAHANGQRGKYARTDAVAVAP